MKLSARLAVYILFGAVVASIGTWAVFRGIPKKAPSVAKKPAARYPYAKVPGVRKAGYKSSATMMLRRLTDLPNMVNVDSDIIVVGTVHSITRTGTLEDASAPGLEPACIDYHSRLMKYWGLERADNNYPRRRRHRDGDYTDLPRGR